MIYQRGPLEGQIVEMPAGLLRDLPFIRVRYRTRTQNHFYSSRRWNGRSRTLDLIYRGIVGVHSRARNS